MSPVETERAGAQRPVVGGAHLEPGSRWPGDGAARVDRPQQRRRAAAVGVGHQQQHAFVEVGQVGGLQGLRRQLRQHRAHLGLRHDQRGERRRRRPVGALGRGGDGGLGRAGQQVVRDPLEQPLADAAGGVQLVGVPSDAGGRELVDVGEHQLGERGQRVGRHPARDGGRRELAPGDPGTDPVRRQQCLRRPSAARLAPTQLVGTFDGRCGRRPGVGSAAPAGEGEEAAEGQLDGVADGLAHRPAERVGVARHLLDDRRRPRARPPPGSSARMASTASGSSRRPCPAVVRGARRAILLSPANKCDVVVHVVSDRTLPPARSTMES